jgi:hypothetical protein
MQEHVESCEVQVKDLKLEDEATMKEELARVHQEIERLHQK